MGPLKNEMIIEMKSEIQVQMRSATLCEKSAVHIASDTDNNNNNHKIENKN